MDRAPRTARRLALAPLDALLPRAARGRRVPWDRVAGRALAEVSRPVGLDAAGRLRVLCGNDAACREIAAREEHLLAAWETLAGGRAPRPTGLVAWVAATSFAEVRPRTPRREPPAPEPRHLAAAEALIGPVRDSRVRAALVAARASALRRSEAAAEPGSEGSRGDDRRAAITSPTHDGLAAVVTLDAARPAGAGRAGGTGPRPGPAPRAEADR